MSDRFRHGRIDVAEILHGFIDREVLPGLGLEPGDFWSRFESFLVDLAPRNRALLDKRDALQAQIDGWHRERRGKIFDAAAYRQFLTEIGYLVPRGASFGVATAHVDPEITSQAGPQLVVPIMNARYALNAANARWGSLYDALYGTDALLPPDPAKRGFDAERGAKVIAWGRDFLDRIAPLTKGSHKDLSHYYLEHGGLARATGRGRRRRARRFRVARGHLRRSAPPALGPAGPQWAACRNPDRPRPSDRQRRIGPASRISCSRRR